MHGAIDPTNHRRNSFVITEDDYVSFLSRMTNRTAIPSDFKLRFLNSSFLFLGYGLNDWNFRLMLKRLSDPDEFPATTLGKENGDARKHQLSGQKWSWAIQKNCTQVDKGIWEMNDVRIFDLDLNEFVEKLQSQK
jgi:hypothetical protein